MYDLNLYRSIIGVTQKTEHVTHVVENKWRKVGIRHIPVVRRVLLASEKICLCLCSSNPRVSWDTVPPPEII